MRKAQIFYARVDEFWRKQEKYQYLEEVQHVENINWQLIQPDKKHTWLTEGLNDEFDTFLSLGSKESKLQKLEVTESLFKTYSNGVKSNSDAYVYNFGLSSLTQFSQDMVEEYDGELERWLHKGKPNNVEEFLRIDEKKLKWIRNTKRSLIRGIRIGFDSYKIRRSTYRPFCVQYYYFERVFNEEIYQFPKIFPTPATEKENRVICFSAVGNTKTFHCLMSSLIPDLHLTGDSQCFPFCTYNEDGSNRRENVTDWAVEQFRTHYQDNTITKWDIFYYIYAVLHHPLYRERYAANLKRELPRIPYAPDFHAFARAGKRLAAIHVEYEQQPEYPLRRLENNDLPLDWQVERMKLTKDKTAIVYNDFLTLGGIPPETFNYRLGNRSALEWVIDQYRVSTDKRSGIVNNPNRQDDPEYIVRLIGQVITVSLETVQIVNALPSLGLLEPNNNEVLSSTGLAT